MPSAPGRPEQADARPEDIFDRTPPDAEELAERAEWDATLMDGLDEAAPATAAPATDARVCPYCEGGTVPHLVHGIPCRCPACGQLPTRATGTRLIDRAIADLEKIPSAQTTDLRGQRWTHPTLVSRYDVLVMLSKLAEQDGPIGRVDEMPDGERQTFLDMADAAVEHLRRATGTRAVERAAAVLYREADYGRARCMRIAKAMLEAARE